MGKEVEANFIPERQFKESGMNIEAESENFRTMGESVKDTTVPGIWTEGYVEAELLSEGTSVSSE